MDQSENIAVDSETEDSASSSPAWQWIGTVGLRCFFAGPADIDPASLTVPGFGHCEALPSGAAIPAGFNLIRDPEFVEDGMGWNVQWNGRRAVRTEKDAMPPEERRSPFGGCLTVSVPLDDQSSQALLRLSYPENARENRLAAEPRTGFRFGCLLSGGCVSALLVLEFYSADGEIIDRKTADYPMKDDAFDDGGSVAAVAPEGTVGVACHVELTLADGAEDETAIIRLINPSLQMIDESVTDQWVPDTVDDAAYRTAVADGGSRIFFADRRLDLPLDKDDRIEVYCDRVGQSVLSGPPAKTAATARLEFWPIKGDLVEIRVAEYSGPLIFVIDETVCGAKWILPSARPLPVTFRIPRAKLDSEYHRLQLLDGKGLRILGSDFAHIGDQIVDWSSLLDNVMPPYPAHLSPKAARRMDAMRRQFAWFGSRTDLSDDDAWLLGNLHRIEQALTAGFDRNGDFFPLRFPETEQPTVSIVIPVHGQYAATFHCLCSLLFARCDASFEVIVVDDGSPDQTAQRLAEHSGLRIVERPKSEGFIAACNDGAAEARGEYVVFLNNDCEATAGWLDELIGSFANFPGTGAACPQMLHDDGRLQNAGNIVWNDGRPQNVGWNKNPRDPRYSYSRDTDYLAGAALITLKSVWDEIGGFETELSPAYFEDTWYSFAVREAGYRTIYCATAAVYHTRGVTNGTDPDAEDSVKRFQTINHPKFKRRWHRAYRDHGTYDEDDVMLEKDRRAKKRVLMIGWRVPRPDQDAGSYSTLHEMRMLQDLNCKVTFLPTNFEFAGRYTEALQRIGVEALHAPFVSSVSDFLAERGGEFDLVLVSRYTILRPHIRAIRELASQAKLVLNIEDLHFVREMRRAIAVGDADAEEEVHALRETELNVIRQSDLVLSYSGVEIALLGGLVGRLPKLAKLPWVEEARPGAAEFGQREGLCFLGNHLHPPNAGAVDAYAHDIAPQLGPSAPTLHVYGAHWPANGEFQEDDPVRIEGFASDMGETFDRHRVFVAPLKSGAGLKGKVLLAMAHGLPTILSPIAAEGIEMQPGTHCLVAETPAEWAEAIERLSTDETLWTEIREAALTLIERNYAREDGVEKWRRILESADIFV